MVSIKPDAMGRLPHGKPEERETKTLAKTLVRIGLNRLIVASLWLLEKKGDSLESVCL
jgi:hypothetical protein